MMSYFRENIIDGTDVKVYVGNMIFRSGFEKSFIVIDENFVEYLRHSDIQKITGILDNLLIEDLVYKYTDVIFDEGFCEMPQYRELFIKEIYECIINNPKLTRDQILLLHEARNKIIHYTPKPRESKKKKSISGYLYIIHSDYGYKIGVTKNYYNRKKLFNVKLPFETKTVALYYGDKYEEIEVMLHKIYNDKNLNGEWFNLNCEDIESIDAFMTKHGFDKIESGERHERI